MARFYTKERSKYGSLTGTIIIWPTELPSTNPSNPENVRVLPSGYLRCDGARYKASDYPDLAAVCGTGRNSKFVRRDIDGNPTIELGDDEFVVPDLGSKYPRPVPGPDAGTYNNIVVRDQNNVVRRRSGIGIEASSNVGTVARVNYSGRFIIPSQTIKLRGKPSFTFGNSGLTDSETIEAEAIHPHMHFSTTTRVRIKPRNAPPSGQDLPASVNSFRNASTVNIQDWLNATRYNEGGFQNNTPGSNQQPCWAIASGTRANTSDQQFIVPLPPPLNLGSVLRAFTNFCRTGCSLNDLRCYCLANEPITYDLSRDWWGFPGTQVRRYVISILGCFPDIAVGTEEPWNVSGTAPATYIQGATGVPRDFNDNSLFDVLPLDSNFVNATSFPQAHNIISEVEENSLGTTEDGSSPTLHNHKILFERGEPNFSIVTNSFLLEPDALNTTVNLFPTTVASLDAVTSPFIMLEYLIKT
jgi:hypothetical protein